MAASSRRRLICESILDGKRNGECHEGGRELRIGDSLDGLVVVHAGVKEGLDHSGGKFGYLGTSGSILGLFFGRIVFLILSTRTAEQSTMQNSQQQILNEGDSKNKGKPQVLQLLGGFHYGHELVGVIPKQLVE